MPRPLRNAANNVSVASNEVSNAASWSSVVLEKINQILDNIIQQKFLELDVEIPLGDNIAHLFGKEKLSIDGKFLVIRPIIRVKLPEEKTNG